MNLLQSKSGALVYDIGASVINFGFAGDAQPIYSVPSASCRRPKDDEQYIEFGHSWLSKTVPGIEVQPMIDDSGAISDPGLLSSFFDWTYQNCLGIEPADRPVLISQPTHLSGKAAFTKWRLEMCEALFDFAGHPMLCLEYDSTLAAFARATTTATVVDFGWSCARVVPIHEGRPLLASMKLSSVGGYELAGILEKAFDKENRPIKTLFDLPNCTVVPSESQKRYCKREVLNDIIKNCLTLEREPPAARWDYYMAGHDRIQMMGVMQWLCRAVVDPEMVLKRKDTLLTVNLQHAISNDHTPADIRRQLWGNVVLSGGLSNIPGFGAWLEMSAKAPGHYAAKILPAPNRVVGGSNTVWAGGSILGSLDTFPEFCITREEWKEFGPSILESKCQ